MSKIWSFKKSLCKWLEMDGKEYDLRMIQAMSNEGLH